MRWSLSSSPENMSLLSRSRRANFRPQTFLKPHQTYATSLKRPQGRVVVLGSGWAGFKFLKKVDQNRHEVVVVSPRNYFVFTPLLASTCVGTLEYRCITEPLRKHAKDLVFYEAAVRHVDFENKVLTVESKLADEHEFQITFDKLVIACGALSNTFNIPGVRENSFFLKDIGDARKIRAQILENFEKAKQPNVSPEHQKELLHFCTVGGGPTGVEFSAELHDFITENLSKLYPDLMDKVQMTLIDVSPKILTSFDGQLADYATQKFRRKGINVKTDTRVVKVNADSIELQGQDPIKTQFVVWATGLAPNPLVTSLGLPLDPGKRLLTDGNLRVLDAAGSPMEGIFALGDCAVIKGNALPQTAQVATQKAIYLANQFNAVLKGKEIADGKPFLFQNMGTLAYIGSWQAIADTPATTGKGTGAWLFWRSAYFTMSVSLKNKILIPMYWILTWIAGRDTTRI
ncbi:hypothetical protein HDV03_003921 [Kappamyces sp. JEL0829]|nr:hypothetical protein HDV03_003921 [Kappamyces sp. JEL0829]